MLVKSVLLAILPAFVAANSVQAREPTIDRARQLGYKRGLFDRRGLFDGLKDLIGDAADAVEEIGNDIVDGAKDVANGANEIISPVLDGSGTPGDIVGGGLDAIGTIGDIIRGDDGDATAAAAAAAGFGAAPPANWMQANLGTLGDRTIGNLAIPGSHDAGMSSFASGTGFATEDNTRTQRIDLGAQLVAGARYFDIRPAITAGSFRTGHYSFIEPINSWQGGNGQAIEEMIDQLNAFTRDNKELVILNLSHDINTDLPNTSFRPFNQEEYDRLFNALLRIENRFVAPTDPTSIDLTSLTLNDFIGGNKAAVVVVVEPGSIALGDFANQGFYRYGQFGPFNSFADKNDANAMGDDQINKMNEQRPGNYFLLSWTVTQQGEQVVLGPSIVDMADGANALMFSKLVPASSNEKFPNIVFVDDYRSEITALTLQINERFRA